MKHIQGGFGSAGAGNRTGRFTWRKDSRATTASKRSQEQQRAFANAPEPTQTELAESIRVFRCWWCGADRKKDGRVFTSLSQHWLQAHGIATQHVRDILGVKKHTSFIAVPLHDAFQRRAKDRYVPGLLQTQTKGRKRQMSAYGVKTCREKLERAVMEAGGRSQMGKRAYASRVAALGEEVVHERLLQLVADQITQLGREKYAEKMREISRTSAEKSRRVRQCVICGESFWRKGKSGGVKGRKTCSDVCSSVYRQQQYRPHQPAPTELRICPACHINYIARCASRRKTCGADVCRRLAISQKARDRDKQVYQKAGQKRSNNPSTKLNQALALLPTGEFHACNAYQSLTRTLNISCKHAAAILSTLANQSRLFRVRRGVYQQRTSN